LTRVVFGVVFAVNRDALTIVRIFLHCIEFVFIRIKVHIVITVGVGSLAAMTK
jgi:hypothetical protein